MLTLKWGRFYYYYLSKAKSYIFNFKNFEIKNFFKWNKIPSRFKLFDLLTIVATVRQYNALAKQSFVILETFELHIDLIRHPFMVRVREVRPFSNDFVETPNRAATEFSSFSLSEVTRSDELLMSKNSMLPNNKTVANTRTTSIKGIPSIPRLVLHAWNLQIEFLYI